MGLGKKEGLVFSRNPFDDYDRFELPTGVVKDKDKDENIADNELFVDANKILKLRRGNKVITIKDLSTGV